MSLYSPNHSKSPPFSHFFHFLFGKHHTSWVFHAKIPKIPKIPQVHVSHQQHHLWGRISGLRCHLCWSTLWPRWCRTGIIWPSQGVNLGMIMNYWTNWIWTWIPMDTPFLDKMMSRRMTSRGFGVFNRCRWPVQRAIPAERCWLLQGISEPGQPFFS